MALQSTSDAKLKRAKERNPGREDMKFLDEESQKIFSSIVTSLENSFPPPPSTGDTVNGTVISVDNTGALISIRGKSAAFLPLKEMSLEEDKSVLSQYEVGQTVTAILVGTLKGVPVLSLRTSLMLSAWDKVLAIKEKDEAFAVRVLEINKGGAVCSVFGLKGFIPGSHFIGIPSERLIGTSITVSKLWL
jgi:ribosomal protein S1